MPNVTYLSIKRVSSSLACAAPETFVLLMPGYQCMPSLGYKVNTSILMRSSQQHTPQGGSAPLDTIESTVHVIQMMMLTISGYLERLITTPVTFVTTVFLTQDHMCIEG